MAFSRKFFFFQVITDVPDLTVIRSVQRIAWVSAAGILHLLNGTNEEIHKSYDKVGHTFITAVCNVMVLFQTRTSICGVVPLTFKTDFSSFTYWNHSKKTSCK